MSRLRWRLARWIAPLSIMVDPFPDLETGAFAVMREGGVSASIRFTKARMRSRIKPLRRLYGGPLDGEAVYEDRGSCTTFVGIRE